MKFILYINGGGFLQNYIDNPGIRLNYIEENAVEKLGKHISNFIDKDTLILCIGTDKCIGDCLGPLVGTFLKNNNFPYPVIGTLDHPAHAINLDSVIKDIYSTYPNYFVIAIDACIGYDDCIGDIQVKIGPVHPGKGVGKVLPHVGDISIVGVVDTVATTDIFSIRNIRLNFIMKMADIISKSLLYAVKKLE